MNLESIAVRLTRDLKEVVFVGAFAVSKHLDYARRTQDIDLALATPVSEEELEGLGYRIRQEGGKKVVRTVEGIKVDIYQNDVSGISVSKIFETAVSKQIGETGSR